MNTVVKLIILLALNSARCYSLMFATLKCKKSDFAKLTNNNSLLKIALASATIVLNGKNILGVSVHFAADVPM